MKVFDQQTNPGGELKPRLDMSVALEDEEQEYDDEEEFFADYRKSSDSARYVRRFGDEHRNTALMQLSSKPGTRLNDVQVDVKVEAERLPQILAVLNVFEANRKTSLLPVEKEPIVFIGHGHSEDWKQLKDHLREMHGFKVEAYETGPRAGHTIEQVLQTMLNKASIAFLVMTGEDETVAGSINPRLNVVHELGLFQGKLGFKKAIILLKRGAAEFSNIEGLQQIRFTEIKEVFGEVVATINRESRNEKVQS
ncbi:MAG TPA: TIR domain-containing protein [Chthoniobacterales bacterium]|nr:TIR domain-containing protein [Chthoniobacterales bacterium]